MSSTLTKNTFGKSGGDKRLQRHFHEGVRSLVAGGNSAAPAASGSGNNYQTKTDMAGDGNSGNLAPYLVLNDIIKY